MKQPSLKILLIALITGWFLNHITNAAPSSSKIQLNKQARQWIKSLCHNANQKTQGLVILGRIRMDFNSPSGDVVRFGFYCQKEGLIRPHLEYVLGKNRSIPLDVEHFTFEAWPELPPSPQRRRYFLAMTSESGEQLLYRLVLDPSTPLNPFDPLQEVGVVDEEDPSNKTSSPSPAARPYTWIHRASGFYFKMGSLLRKELCKIKTPLTEDFDECILNDNLWFPSELSVIYQKQTRYFSAFPIFRRLGLNELEYPGGQVSYLLQSFSKPLGIESKLASFEALMQSFAHSPDEIRDLKKLVETKIPSGEL